MRVLFCSGGLEVVLFEGEKGYRGLGVVLGQDYGSPRLYVYEPELVRYGDIVESVVKELAKGLGARVEEFLVAGTVFLEHGTFKWRVWPKYC